MKGQVSKFLFREPSQWQFWLLFAFFCKASIFILLLCRHEYSSIPGFWGLTSGDTPTYLEPIDNFIKQGNYSPDIRMPGYGILYMPFAFFFSQPVACNIVIILQLILSAVSVYPLALIAKMIFKSTNIFYLVLYIYCISTYTNMYDDALLTESFATAFLIFSMYYLAQFLTGASASNRKLFLSGLFFTETIFLRPAFAPLIIIVPAIIMIYMYTTQKKITIIKPLVFIVSFIIADGTWTLSRYEKHHEINPLTVHWLPSFENSHILSLITLIQAWGGDWTMGASDSQYNWFVMKEDSIAGKQASASKNNIFPDQIYTSKFNYDSLLVLRNNVQQYITLSDDSKLSQLKKEVVLNRIREASSRYSNSVKAENPFLYYVKAPLTYLRRFIANSGTYNLFNNVPLHSLNYFQIFVKIIYSLFYWMILLFGTAGIIILAKTSFQNLSIATLLVIILYTVIAYPMIFRQPEFRYLIPAYPFMVIFATYAISNIKRHSSN